MFDKKIGGEGWWQWLFRVVMLVVLGVYEKREMERLRKSKREKLLLMSYEEIDELTPSVYSSRKLASPGNPYTQHTILIP